MNSRDRNWTSVNYHMFPNIMLSRAQFNRIAPALQSNLNISVRNTENAEQPANIHVLTRKF